MDTILDRRRLLILGASGSASMVLAACGSKATTLVGATDPAVGLAEQRRRPSGARVVERTLVAAPLTVDLAGRQAPTWAFGEAVPGTEIRLKVGDVLRVGFTNKLPEDTSIHWHGIAIRNDMDGVHDLTQSTIKPGGTFVYEFALAHAGTYFFHPHVGLQLDRGLYAPLIVEDPNDPVTAEVDQVLVLDDWLDGIDGATPDSELAKLRQRGGMDNMGGSDGGMGSMGGMTSPLLGGDAGDVAYPLHLINGRPPADRPTFTAAPGARVRLRIINAASDTAYRFAIGGHRLTVTHTDGFPVRPVEVDALLLGMAERYDVILTANSGAWPMVASAEGKTGAAVAVLRTSDAGATMPPAVDARPGELDGKLLTYADLTAAESVALAPGAVDRTHLVDLTGGMADYSWGIGGKPFPKSSPLQLREGERVRMQFRNKTMMWHPIHLHGHTFALSGGGARKDTVNVLPGRSEVIEFIADNPGQWMLHCHNTYHLETGMATVVSYRR